MAKTKPYAVDPYLHGQLIYLCTVDPKFWAVRMACLSPVQLRGLYDLALRLAHSAASVAAVLKRLEGM